MKTYQLSPLALSAGLVCMLTASLAQADCPTTVTTVPLASTSSAPMTQVEINNAINNASSASTTVINLSGTFLINDAINLADGRNCLVLQSAAGQASARLKWNPSSTSPRFLIEGHGNRDITLRNIYLEGRSVVLVAPADGIASHVIDQVRFINSRTTDVKASGANYILRLLPYKDLGKTSGWKIVNSTFQVVAGQDAPYRNTAIVGYNADNVFVSNNFFVNVDQGMHFMGLTNARILYNKGTGIQRSAIEIQEGDTSSGTFTYTNKNIEVTGNTFANWRGGMSDDSRLGMSFANGMNYKVSNNTILFQGSDLTSCEKAPVPKQARGSMGVEFAAVNSSASGNVICGFDSGFTLGIVGTYTPYTGTNTVKVENNTLSNINGEAIQFMAKNEWSPIVGNGVCETPLSARTRGVTEMESASGKFLIRGNKINNARVAGIVSGDAYYANSCGPLAIDVLASHTTQYAIENNTITRTFGFFPTDTGAETTQEYFDKRFYGIRVPPIRVASALSVSGNSIQLNASPLDPATNFLFRGIVANTVSPDGLGTNNFEPNKNFNGSVMRNNIVASTPNQFGTGLHTDHVSTDNWVGFLITGNQLSNLSKGISRPAGSSTASIAGNTCTNVLTPGGGC